MCVRERLNIITPVEEQMSVIDKSHSILQSHIYMWYLITFFYILAFITLCCLMTLDLAINSFPMMKITRVLNVNQVNL